MANKDDYLTEYRKFFEYFAETVNPNDQLPVKLSSYKLVNVEVVGGIVDWTSQYLTQKQCPQSLLAPLIKIVIDEIRKSCKKRPGSCGFNTSEEVYEPLKLMQAVMAKTNEICLRYMDNSMLCSLPTPGAPHHVVSVYAIKNIRRKMEDRHVVINDLNTMFSIQEASPSSYYAIFDGHAGHDAAAYSSAHLHQFLAESKHFVNNPEQALIDAFYTTDALFMKKEEKLSSGTTAVCALLKPKEKTLYIAWVGDSQALLVRNGVFLQCVVPHKPGREDEKLRIEQGGGMVVFWGTWRVNGQLAVSRAIGDREYKPYVTAVPEIQEISLTGNEDFLILACDGLWDFLSEAEAANTVYNMVCTNTDDTDSISQRLVQLAKKQGSTDNISVIVVFLREPSKVAADAHWANRNTLPTTMDTGLDNANAANNPFTNSNGTEILQKDDFLLNLTEGLKQNGGNIASPSNDFFEKPANGKRTLDEFDEDEDMGPETDVDAVDDIPSPALEQKAIFPDNKENAFNPFTDIDEKSSFDMDLELQNQQSSEFDLITSQREETPTPSADEVNDAAIDEYVAESGGESEDEWNYYKGNSAGAENSSSKADQEVAEITKAVEEEDEDEMSQLNPNAAEFVPISSPTRSISSPACRGLIDDPVIAQSPRRTTPQEVDINLPNLQEFESEVKSRPSDIFNNSHESENCSSTNESLSVLSSQEVMENLLNGKNLEDIEFHPSTPSKTLNPDEFHFGPNATPFSTPAKPLDQSEAGLSTKAVFGDESTASYLAKSFTDSFANNQHDEQQEVKQLTKQDPMSTSFYQDENDDTSPFDLDRVQTLPDNIDEFIGDVVENGQQDYKENLDPIQHTTKFENEALLLGVSQLPKTPEPEIHSNSPSLEEVAKAPLPITPEPILDALDDEIQEEQPKEETDLCMKFDSVGSVPLQSPVDLVLNENVCDIKKSSADSSPETEELSQISDAGDEIPPLSISPEVTNDFRQFKSEIQEAVQDVCQISSEPNVEELSAKESVFSKFQDEGIHLSELKPNVELNQPPLELKEDELCQFPVEISSTEHMRELVPELTEDIFKLGQISEKVEEVLCQPPLRPETVEVELCQTQSEPISHFSQEPQLQEEPIEQLEGNSASENIIETKLEDIQSDFRPSELFIPDESMAMSRQPLETERPSEQEAGADIASPVFSESSLPSSSAPLEETNQNLESPMEDITSSIKDDVSTSEIIEEAKDTNTEKEILSKMPIAESTSMDITNQLLDATSENKTEDNFFDSTIKSNEPTEIIELSSFLDKSIAPDVASPLSPPTQAIEDVLFHSSEIIKTDLIAPQFPEEATITSPSEETKTESPTVEVKETPTALLEVKQDAESKIEQMVAATVVGTTAAVAATVAVAASIKSEEKKLTKQTATRTNLKAVPKSALGTKPISKSLGKAPTSKPTSPTKSATTSRVSTTRTATTTTKPPTSSASARVPAKPAPKPRQEPTKRAEKKPLWNGDTKPTLKPTLTKRTPTTSTSKPSPTTTSRLAAVRLSPTKPAVDVKTSSMKPATPKLATPTGAVPKPRPTSLNSSTGSATSRTALTTKSTLTKTTTATSSSPKATTPKIRQPVPIAKPKPATAPAKPKSLDSEKQIKDSVNKALTSRTTTAKAGSATHRTTTTTVKKIESKTTIPRTTTTKTTITSIKSTKKPTEITRVPGKMKAAPTKTTKPQQNGLTNGVTTVVQETTTIISTEPQLIKDLSPVENKFVLDNLQIAESNVAD